ncbi:MAG: phosphatase PAP2 family protein [Dehalococcoidia bacterium]|nr:phosphatase PAP2 family protein [Dehalococcoidia bacterium]
MVSWLLVSRSSHHSFTNDALKARNSRLLLVAVMAASLALWVAFLVIAVREEPPGWDISAAEHIRSWDAPGLDRFLKGVSWLGNVEVVVATEAALILALVALRRPRQAAPFLAAGLLQVATQALKEVIGRERPDQLVHPGNDSFPSGHVVHSVVFFGLLAAFLLPLMPWRPARWALIALYAGTVAATGLSRVFLGHHWPSDVLGGVLLGIPILGLALLLRWWLQDRHRVSAGDRSQ